MKPIPIPGAPGDLLDKISILQIKVEKIKDALKRANASLELALLSDLRDKELPTSVDLERLFIDLKSVNETLWQIEDDIRSHERIGDFGTSFVELARGVYHQNDRRAALKRQINTLLGSDIVEEKSYTVY